MEMLGRFHPLIVHLPVGILLIAILFEWLGLRDRHRSLSPALPLIWKAGAAAALLACATGLLLGRSGNYDDLLLDRHQYLGLATAVCCGIIAFLPKRRIIGLVAGVLLLGTLHLGSSLTHGARYLLPGNQPSEIGVEQQETAATELPDVPLNPAAEKDLVALRHAGISVTPLAEGSPWLSVHFVNADTVSDSVFLLLGNIAPQVSRLNLRGISIPTPGWPVLSKCRNLTRLNLSGSNVEDARLRYLDGLQYLVQLNLSQTKVQLRDMAVLKRLPALQRLFLFNSSVPSGYWPALFQALPHTRIDTGGYLVPTLESDTVMMKEKEKY